MVALSSLANRVVERRPRLALVFGFVKVPDRAQAILRIAVALLRAENPRSAEVLLDAFDARVASRWKRAQARIVGTRALCGAPAAHDRADDGADHRENAGGLHLIFATILRAEHRATNRSADRSQGCANSCTCTCHAAILPEFDGSAESWFGRRMTLEQWVLKTMVKAWLSIGTIVGITPKDVASAIAQASAEKPLFTGGGGARQTGALMTAIGVFESGFNNKAVGDGGTSFCFGQIHLPDGAKTAEGWTADELMADPLKCARSMREILRRSIKISPVGYPLLHYAGTRKTATARFKLARELLSVPFDQTTEAAP